MNNPIGRMKYLLPIGISLILAIITIYFNITLIDTTQDTFIAPLLEPFKIPALLLSIVTFPIVIALLFVGMEEGAVVLAPYIISLFYLIIREKIRGNQDNIFSTLLSIFILLFSTSFYLELKGVSDPQIGISYMLAINLCLILSILWAELIMAISMILKKPKRKNKR